MKILIEDYMKQTQKERQQHLDLNTDCIEIGGNSTKFQGLLVGYLNTTFPSDRSPCLAHACNNGKCSNVLHLYWATAKENWHDTERPTIHEKKIIKWGKEKANAMNSHPETAHLGGKANKGIPKKQSHRDALSEAGKKDWEKRKAKKQKELYTLESFF